MLWPLRRRKNTPVILLRDGGARLMLPIWIPQAQAQQVLASLERRVGSRPLTHELFGECFEALGASVQAVEIYALVKRTFYARLVLEDSVGRTHAIECRPSDGISIALRAGCPIRVERGALRVAQPMGGNEPDDTETETPFVFEGDVAGLQRLMDGLAAMEPRDFGELRLRRLVALHGLGSRF